MTMTKENQRIEFLQHLGWTDLNRDSKLGNYRALRGTSPSGVKNQIAPNPLKNLNVIHEAEKLLDEQQWMGYTSILWKTCGDIRQDVCATAEQRLEAYLKTLNLWES